MMDIPDVSRTQINELIEECIFNERDRAVLRRRLLDGVRFEPLAEEFGLSVRHTKSIVYKGSAKIFSKIK